MQSPFGAQAMPLGQLFADPNFIHVPSYQRSFAWTPDEAGRLLDDVSEALDAEAESDQGATISWALCCSSSPTRPPGASPPGRRLGRAACARWWTACNASPRSPSCSACCATSTRRAASRQASGSWPPSAPARAPALPCASRRRPSSRRTCAAAARPARRARRAASRPRRCASWRCASICATPWPISMPPGGARWPISCSTSATSCWCRRQASTGRTACSRCSTPPAARSPATTS